MTKRTVTKDGIPAKNLQKS